MTAVILLLQPSVVAAKQTRIAVLGIEGRGCPAEVLSRFDKAMSQSIAGVKSYELVPGKPLDEIKLVFGCLDEQPACMSKVGRSLHADKLLWGTLELDGESNTLVLKLLNVATGTTEGLERATFNAADTKTPTPVLARLVRSMLGVVTEVPIVPAPGKDDPLSGQIVDNSGGQSRTGWKIAFWVSAGVAVGAAVGLIPNGLKINDLEQEKEDEILRLVADDSGLTDPEREQVSAEGCAVGETSNTATLNNICSEGHTRAVLQNVLIGVSAASAALSVFFAYKAFFETRETPDSNQPTEKASREHDANTRWTWLPVVGASAESAHLGVLFQY